MQNSSVTVQKCSTGAFFHCVRIPNVNRTKNKKHHPVDGVFYFGCRIGIRTPTNRVRVCRATVTQFGNVPRTHYSIASSPAFVKIFFKKIENFPPDFSARRKNPSRRLQRCINVVKYSHTNGAGDRKYHSRILRLYT